VSTPVIDTHLHLWDTARFEYPWLSGAAAINRPFLARDVDRGRSGVTGAVFVQADCAPEQALAEVAWVSDTPRDTLPIDGIVAFAPLETGAAVRTQLESLAEFPLVVGVRRILQSESAEFFELPQLADGLAELARAGLTFDACVSWRQLGSLVDLLGRVPEITVVLDHVGKPPVAAGFDSGHAREWLSSLQALAEIDQVSVKLSGLAPEAGPGLGDELAQRVRPFLDAALETFGADRCMVGSDWPVSAWIPEERSYESWFALVLDDWGLSSAERASIASTTAERVYGLEGRQQARAL
jgi:L-fuconolactonase